LKNKEKKAAAKDAVKGGDGADAKGGAAAKQVKYDTPKEWNDMASFVEKALSKGSLFLTGDRPT
jgi:hypothetical protein